MVSSQVILIKPVAPDFPVPEFSDHSVSQINIPEMSFDCIFESDFGEEGGHVYLVVIFCLIRAPNLTLIFFLASHFYSHF